MNNFIKKERLIDRIQDSNLNFLFGSGMSADYLKVLGNIETLLTDLDKEELDKDKKLLIRASILNEYFEGVIEKNIDILDNKEDTQLTLTSYKTFFETINKLILLRRNKLLSKQVNIFTTNIDIFLEKAIESNCLEGNDGFGRGFKPKYDLSNFKKSIFQKSLYFDNNSEIPVFNILKIHGSITWLSEKETIYFDATLQQIRQVKNNIAKKSDLLEFKVDDDIKSLLDKVPKKIKTTTFKKFLEEYDKLSIVNPTKAKFQTTVLDQKYYDLLRIYSNELERENTLLFVMGFSFADEHIKDLTIRLANSNPTLMIYVFARSQNSKKKFEAILGIETKIKNKNIVIVAPELDKEGKDSFEYNFNTINQKIFGGILAKISKPINQKVFKATLESMYNE